MTFLVDKEVKFCNVRPVTQLLLGLGNVNLEGYAIPHLKGRNGALFRHTRGLRRAAILPSSGSIPAFVEMAEWM